MHTPIVGAFFSELFGLATIILLGTGLGANMNLPRTKGHGSNWLLVSLGWGVAVFTGVYVAFRSGAHLNPAFTIGMLVAGQPFNSDSASQFGTIEPTVLNAAIYIIAQLLGAFLGAVLAWLAYKKHFDLATDPDVIRGTFATEPALRTPAWNVLSEVVATFVLVFWIIVSGPTPEALGPLAVALVITAIGAGLGGTTGYAINPARDLGPRFAHEILPIPGKGSSDWGYAWVPIVAPLAGGLLAGLAAHWWLTL